MSPSAINMKLSDNGFLSDGAGYAWFHHVYAYLQWLQIHHYNKIIYENNE